MWMRASGIIGRKVDGADGELGRIKDLFFDDVSYAVRHVVVGCGPWFDQLEVLIVPTALRGFERFGRPALTCLSRQQVEASPPVGSDLPPSRAFAERQRARFASPLHWVPPATAMSELCGYHLADAYPAGTDLPEEVREAFHRRLEDADPHLRSLVDLEGNHIRAQDGEIGHVTDALVDLGDWQLKQLIADTRNWLPGHEVVLDCAAIELLRWEDARVVTGLSKRQIKSAPRLRDVQKTNPNSIAGSSWVM